MPPKTFPRTCGDTGHWTSAPLLFKTRKGHEKSFMLKTPDGSSGHFPLSCSEPPSQQTFQSPALECGACFPSCRETQSLLLFENWVNAGASACARALLRDFIEMDLLYTLPASAARPSRSLPLTDMLLHALCRRGCYGTLDRVPWALQQDPRAYPHYKQQPASTNPKLPIHPAPCPWAATRLVPTAPRLLLLRRQVHPRPV